MQRGTVKENNAVTGESHSFDVINEVRCAWLNKRSLGPFLWAPHNNHIKWAEVGFAAYHSR